MRRIIFTMIFITTSLFMSSCNNNDAPNKMDRLQEITKPETYTVYHDIKSHSEIYTLKKLDIPEEIQSYKISCSGVLDKNNILLVLFNDEVTKEIGVYNHVDNKYQSEIILKDNQLFEICCLSTEYIILRLSEDNWSTSELFYYTFSDKTLNKIFSYSINPETGASFYDNTNKILLVNDTVYFDDFCEDENSDIQVNLYSYEIKSSKLSFLKKNSQNPICYNKNVYTFEKNSNNAYKNLNSLNNKDSIIIDEELMTIASFENGIYCIENMGLDAETDTTISQIKEIISDVPIISTNLPVDLLECNNNFVTWRNFRAETPCLYDIKENALILFDGIDKGVSTFFIADNYGIFRHRIDQTDTYFFETYFFEK